ncbi:lipase family protein [Sorangium sp. So ce406]|uniref:lipase family protein n=1 Tax=Sorangium sp. So ce406 TaxID=3133311 RepID=UPI003F5C3A6D
MIIEGVRMVDDAEEPSADIAGQDGTRIDRRDDDICGRGPWGAIREKMGYDRFLDTDEGEHDRYLANVLCVASAWAYSDIDTFARVMHCRGFMRGSETVGVTDKNPAMFERTTAYLVQSKNRRLAILCFRGTEMKNAIDALVEPDSLEPLLSAGRVHGGFSRSLLALWPTIEMLLKYACKGRSICDAAMRARARARNCVEEDSRHDRAPGQIAGETMMNDGSSRSSPPPTDEGGDKLEALYITGHGIGGALAVIAAALIDMTPSLQSVRKTLRGIYTYGQPKVGDTDFANTFQPRFGSKLFRHVSLDDNVIYMPLAWTGEFWRIRRTVRQFKHFYVHLGQMLVPSEAGWTSSATLSLSFRFVVEMMVRGWNLGASVGVYTAPRILDEYPFLKFLNQMNPWAPKVQRDPLPRRFLRNNSPIRYLRMSRTVVPGSELL